MKDCSLVVNCGSATLKWALFDARLREQGSGNVERIGLSGTFAHFAFRTRPRKYPFSPGADYCDAFRAVAAFLRAQGLAPSAVIRVGHRVVHGGNARIPERISPAVMQGMVARTPLAPLHHPAQLLGIRAAMRIFPQAQHVAVYDTLFFHDLPLQAATYALPLALQKRFGIRRFGFHGLSHASVARETARRLGRPFNTLNCITVHLGSGCSMAAISRGKPTDTTMGFTPLEGLVMGTRSGDLDPGILLFLLREGKFSAAQLEELLDRRSGLLGLTGGWSSDFRDILVAAGIPVSGWRLREPVSRLLRTRCRLALDLFVYRIRKYLGAFAATLDRVDAVVFTGGIGERNAAVRALCLRGLRLPGRPRVFAIPSDEEGEIARLLRIRQ